MKIFFVNFIFNFNSTYIIFFTYSSDIKVGLIKIIIFII
jgi:hypothetical protein